MTSSLVTASFSPAGLTACKKQASEVVGAANSPADSVTTNDTAELSS